MGSMADKDDARAGETSVGPPGTTDDHGGEQGADHGHDDHGPADHGHGAEALGPFDLPAWGAAGLGIVLGLVVVFAFIQAAA
jgi:hypothetical protein